MKRLVSQKTRLIPSLRVIDARTHRRVRLPTDAFLNPALGVRGRSSQGHSLPFCSNRGTTATALHNRMEVRLGRESSSNPLVMGGKDRLAGKVGDDLLAFRAAFDNVQGWGRDWRRSEI